MTNHPFLHYRWIRRLAMFMAAAPLFQLAQCDTGTRQVLANVANGLPATMFSIMQGFLLLPMQLLFGIWGNFVPTGTA